jgi:hypothetical protein
MNGITTQSLTGENASRCRAKAFMADPFAGT